MASPSTQVRATATGRGVGIRRSGWVIGSALRGLLLSGLGASGYFMTLVVPLVLPGIAPLAVRSSATKAVEVEEV
ncbi:hypothetical protein ACXA45_12020 [Neomicrococcus lactis]